MAVVSDLYRYPIKGLSPEALEQMALSREAGLEHDREYALALGTTAFDPERPTPLDKGFFLMLRNNTALAALATNLDYETKQLIIRSGDKVLLDENLTSPAGREATETFFANYLGAETRGQPKIVQAKDHKFTDASVLSPVMMRAISIVNLASVRALSEVIGCELNPLRFRGNIYLEGLAPWQELDWVGCDVGIGHVRFRGLARTPRCAAVNVNPDTAERDVNLPRAIKQNFGHVNLGIYLEVIEGGQISKKDTVTIS